MNLMMARLSALLSFQPSGEMNVCGFSSTNSSRPDGSSMVLVTDLEIFIIRANSFVVGGSKS